MSTFELLPAWPALLAQVLIGRLVLSLLPGGRPGGHGPRDLLATLGASHALGAVAFAAQVAWCRAVGLEAPTWAYLVPWGVLAVGRVLALPGAATPRHEPGEPGPSIATWAGRAALLAALARASADGLEEAAGLAATAALALEALRCLRRSPTGRAWLVAALAWSVVLSRASTLVPPMGSALPLVALAAAGGVAWTRRADARGLTLAAVGACGLAVVDARLLVVAGAAAAALVGVSAAPSRGRAAALALGTAALVLTPLALQGLTNRPGWGGPDALALMWSAPWLAAGAAGLALAQRRGGAQPPGRELAWLVALAAAVGLCALPPAQYEARLLTYLALPVSAVAAGCLLRVRSAP